MTGSKRRKILRWLAAKRRRWNNPVLARAQTRISDPETDLALKRAGLARADLFTPANAIAPHRLRMAHMLAAFEIDVTRAVRDHWNELKEADGRCAQCAETGRCRRWLKSRWSHDAPPAFCPNAALFRAISAGQAQRDVGSFLTG